ncbi:unnamed protein product [Lactuca saligna]|uniref:Uncharacterized protein n=1 Tax=Lactuca saligna TaxID=75948 RepID=A0AA35YW97_LACSI|nr:unnamed protein product [Lactuca saligna]
MNPSEFRKNLRLRFWISSQFPATVSEAPILPMNDLLMISIGEAMVQSPTDVKNQNFVAMAENMVTQEHDELTEALNNLFTNVSTMIKGDLQVSLQLLAIVIDSVFLSLRFSLIICLHSN